MRNPTHTHPPCRPLLRALARHSSRRSHERYRQLVSSWLASLASFMSSSDQQLATTYRPIRPNSLGIVNKGETTKWRRRRRSRRRRRGPAFGSDTPTTQTCTTPFGVVCSVPLLLCHLAPCAPKKRSTLQDTAAYTHVYLPTHPGIWESSDPRGIVRILFCNEPDAVPAPTGTRESLSPRPKPAPTAMLYLNVVASSVVTHIRGAGHKPQTWTAAVLAAQGEGEGALISPRSPGKQREQRHRPAAT